MATSVNSSFFILVIYFLFIYLFLFIYFYFYFYFFCRCEDATTNDIDKEDGINTSMFYLQFGTAQVRNESLYFGSLRYMFV